MIPPAWLGADDRFTLLKAMWDDGERVFHEALLDGRTVLAVVPAAEHATPGTLDRLAHEYDLRKYLDGAWALRPLELVREHGHTAALAFECPQGEPLDRLVGSPMEVGTFLRLAITLSAVVGRLHESGLVHKDIKPANIIIAAARDKAWLTGFGMASCLPRERHSPEAPEFIEGTLAYMAPEQTGRMNRSIDSRSDLYSLGVLFYQLLTGCLPFTASDPMEWVHCHIARAPIPPDERVKNVPPPVSAIVMKLLAKTAEERYQTAAGVERDLRRCLADWERCSRIDDFRLGELDGGDRLLIPEKLYGRTREIAALLSSFNRVVETGNPELVLVSGYSGIGKSSVIHELHKALVPTRGLFASGKFDQYKRDIPYATLAQAFQSLVRPLLAKNEADLDTWRGELRAALGPNAQLIVDVVPELKFVIGEQPPVPPLPPQDAQRRFQLVFRRFLGVFARREHPLALFLDDLQWLDVATIDLLEDLLTHKDVRHLMLMGAYRDNEVSPVHPLMRKLEAIRNAGATVREISLGPLLLADVRRLLVDALRCEPERVSSLAQLVHQKTAGNPFFAIQFISSLAQEQLLSFEQRNARWTWDINRIRAKGYTDNVVDLMVTKLSRLPVQAQQALQQLACLGNKADFAVLGRVYEDSADDVHGNLHAAVRAGLVLQSDRDYAFLHDRVQEAAYSLIPEGARGPAHLRIGRILAQRSTPIEVDETIFEIVSQLNRGSYLITENAERERVAALNLAAARRAKTSTAYESAISYLSAARSLLTEETWRANYELIFAIEFLMAECEILTARMAEAENRLSTLAGRAKSNHDIADVTRLRLMLYTTLDRSDRSVQVCLDYLRRDGTDWSLHPTADDVGREYDRIWSLMGRRQIEELIDLPLMSDPNALDTLEVLNEVVTPAVFFDENLSSLVICHMVNLSLMHGNSDASSFGYVWFAIISGPRFGDYKAGSRFGRLGYDLVEKRGLTRFQARTYMSFGDIVTPWTRHVRTGRELVRRAFDAAYQIGDLTFAAYSRNHLITNLLAGGDALPEVQREAEKGLAFAQAIGFGLVIDEISTQLALVRSLRGLTPKLGSLDDGQLKEIEFERRLSAGPGLLEATCWYYVRKLQNRFFARDYAAAVDASLKAQRLLWTSSSQFETAEFCFYGALSHAACWDHVSPEEKEHHLQTLLAHHRQLTVWAENCPANFENRAALVGAEIARITGRVLEAEDLYERAIRSAHTNGFTHNEAVANEVAARFYETRGFEKIARTYRQDARYCYLRWGADGKVRQLDDLYPQLREWQPSPAPTRTFTAPVEHLDLATVIKVSQAVSGEVVLEKLIDTLMYTAIEHAGAARGLLILARDTEYWVEAEATTTSDAVTVSMTHGPVKATDLPESVLQYVTRTKESVLLNDAASDASFSSDEYIRVHHSRSVLCLPLLKHSRLVGVLYLENELTAGVFTPPRHSVLKLLASEAAISLENVRLYSDLKEREAKVRRLVESNIVGIFMWGDDGRITEANQAFLRIVGRSRDDLLSRPMRWTDLTPEEWRNADALHLAELEATGATRSYEKEYFHKNGSRVPVLVGAATFEGGRNEGVAFVVDLSDRRRAEQAARESERRYRDVELALAHANRVATMGQLSASIAHEINQPIAATVTNAHAALRWLGAQPPNLDEARLAMARIVRDGNRSVEVLARVRALVKKAPPRKDPLEINEAIDEVIALTHGEVAKNGIAVLTHLAEGLPPVQGDRVQLQQVILNLMINAVEAMTAPGDDARELLISTARAEDHDVLVSVRDSGPGLGPGGPEHVFDAFYTTKPRGLGIGLSICRSIVEAHGGRLWASANAPHGALFQFTLPLHPGNADTVS